MAHITTPPTKHASLDPSPTILSPTSHNTNSSSPSTALPRYQTQQHTSHCQSHTHYTLHSNTTWNQNLHIRWFHLRAFLTIREF
eukprot:jgi/Mesvir1/19024/Mv25359-RA.1